MNWAGSKMARKAAKKSAGVCEEPRTRSATAGKMIESFDAQEDQSRSQLALADLEVSPGGRGMASSGRRNSRESSGPKVDRGWTNLVSGERRSGPDWLRAEGTFEELECQGETANMHVRNGGEEARPRHLESGPGGRARHEDVTRSPLRCAGIASRSSSNTRPAKGPERERSESSARFSISSRPGRNVTTPFSIQPGSPATAQNTVICPKIKSQSPSCAA